MAHPPILLCIALLLSGCGDSRKTPEPGSSTPASMKEVVCVKPVYDVTLKAGAGAGNPSVVNWTVKAPTSGWTIITDSVVVQEMLGKTHARIWIRVVQPGPNDAANPPQVTLGGEYRDIKSIEGVEFSVKE